MLDSVKVNNSRPPLRWIANLAGSLASSSIMRISWAEEDQKSYGIAYKINSLIWKTCWPIYYKYGTFYKLDIDMSDKKWDDYDENGIPYWEKTGTVDPDYEPLWDFEDEETGDAFRVVRVRD